MSDLGKIPARTVEDVIEGFDRKVLDRVDLPPRHPKVTKAPRTADSLWKQLGDVNEEVLTHYLTAEHPQTIAVILLNLEPKHAARVIDTLPEKLAVDVMRRMMKAEPVREEVLQNIERTIGIEIIAARGSKTTKIDRQNTAAGILRHVSNKRSKKIIQTNHKPDPLEATEARTTLDTIEDLHNEDPRTIKKILRSVDKKTLATALKGAPNNLVEFLTKHLEANEGKKLRKYIDTLEPTRLSDVDRAQIEVISQARDLAKPPTSKRRIR